VVKLVEKTPAEGLLPLEINGISLTELVPAAITSLMPFDGQEAAASALLSSLLGMECPHPNRSTGRDGARAVWVGRGQIFVVGKAVDASVARHAALTDQSDAWAVFSLQGHGVEDVLARLTPLDLNRAVFKRGHAARSLLGHMSAVILRTGENTFEIMVFRSMARTAVHELETAMRAVAARDALR